MTKAAALSFHALTACVLCGSPVTQVLAMEPVPLVSPNFEGKSDAFVPLNLNQCGGCGHIQVSHVLDPEFNYRKYRYRTGARRGSRNTSRRGRTR